MTMTRVRYYRLIGHEAVPCTAAETSLMSDAQRRVAETRIGDIRISTVFLRMDHDFMGEGPPLLFETMIFADDDDDEFQELKCQRYSTYDEAVAGHNAAINHVITSVRKD